MHACSQSGRTSVLRPLFRSVWFAYTDGLVLACGKAHRPWGTYHVAEIAGQTSSPAAQAAKLRGILELAVTAIITIDIRGLIESVNPATERLFGYGAAWS